MQLFEVTFCGASADGRKRVQHTRFAGTRTTYTEEHGMLSCGGVTSLPRLVMEVSSLRHAHIRACFGWLKVPVRTLRVG